MSEPRHNERKWKAIVFSVVKHDYIPLAVAAHPRFELVAVSDDPTCPDWVHERNSEFAARFDIPYDTDFSAAVAKYRPDVAIVSSEAERHCALAERAAQMGLHLIVDKPLSTHLKDSQRLVDAVRRSGVQSMVWNRNQLPALRQAKDAIERGTIGDLRSIHCDFYFSKDAGPPKGSRGPGEPSINWLERQLEAHADGSDGGVGVEPLGELQVEGFYPLAYIRMLTGSHVRRVFARTAAHFHQANVDNDVDDLATVSLEMDDGLMGSLCLGRIGAASHPDIGEIKLHVRGTKGSMVIAEARPEVSIHYRGQPEKEFRHIRVADENNHLLVDRFVAALDHDRPSDLDVESAHDIAAVVQACIRSGKSGRLENVPRG